MKKTPLNKQSPKQKKLQHSFKKLCMFLIENRAGCACEVKGPNCNNSYLWGHHIVKRSEFRDDSAQNIIIACSKCHDHALYPATGIPVTTVDAKIIVHKRNQSCNISPFLIGDDI